MRSSVRNRHVPSLLRAFRPGADQRVVGVAALHDIARLKEAATMALIDVLPARNCGDRSVAHARKAPSAVARTQEHDRVPPALGIGREAAAARVTMGLVFVVAESEDRPAVLRPGRGDPDAIAVVFGPVRMPSGEDDATVALQGFEIGADEGAVLLMRRKRDHMVVVEPDRTQRGVGNVVFGASIPRPEEDGVHFPRARDLKARLGVSRGLPETGEE